MRRNIFSKIVSLLSYKEKEEYSFYIPEVNEGNSQKQKVKVKSKTVSNEKPRSGMKKPLTLGGSGGESAAEAIPASEKSISDNIEQNLDYLEQCFNYPQNRGIVFRRLKIGGRYKAFIFYIEGMADRVTINNSIIKPLMDERRFSGVSEETLIDHVIESVIETNQIKKTDAHADALNEVLTGYTGVCIHGHRSYILCETKGFEKRGVEKPLTEGVVKGPQEGFNENLSTNISLLRRIIKNKSLISEFLDIGKRSKGKCAIIYLKDLVNPAIVEEVKRRISGISTDFVLGDGFLEQFIEDSTWSIVPTILSTERPDRTAANLLEGKVAILTEGTPFALIVPVTLADLLHTSEDTTLRWQYGILLRAIRMFAVFISTLLPGLYVALTTFHREMIPTDLLIAIAKARENVPFPTILEVLFMELAFELIREAGIRIPGIIGNTIGIIGALILGQAAVQASLVSPVLIIIIAFTGLGNFAIPDFTLALGARIMRIFYVFFGATLGFYGISLGFLISIASLVSLKSFGVPMLSSLTPKTRGSRDFFMRWPVWMQEKRPDFLNPLDVRRQPPISRKWTREKPASYKNKQEGSEKDNE